MISQYHPWYQIIHQALITLPPNSILLDVGTSKRFAKELGLFRHLITDKNYFALGYLPDSHLKEPCDLNGDITALPFLTNSIDALICLEVLEHVANPFLAAAQLYRVLKKGGVMILTVPFLTAYHGKSVRGYNYSHETYPDYWRFTASGLEHLFASFSNVHIYPLTSTLGYYLETICKIPISSINTHGLPGIYQNHVPVTTARHLVIATK